MEEEKKKEEGQISDQLPQPKRTQKQRLLIRYSYGYLLGADEQFTGCYLGGIALSVVPQNVLISYVHQ